MNLIDGTPPSRDVRSSRDEQTSRDVRRRNRFDKCAIPTNKFPRFTDEQRRRSEGGPNGPAALFTAQCITREPHATIFIVTSFSISRRPNESVNRLDTFELPFPTLIQLLSRTFFPTALNQDNVISLTWTLLHFI